MNTDERHYTAENNLSGVSIFGEARLQMNQLTLKMFVHREAKLYNPQFPCYERNEFIKPLV